ncbi:HEPN domain-containing protein [bacterium]|nr:MAG: HEPN domain-containing protein [bacterium]
MLVDEKFRIGTLVDKANESLGAAELLMDERLYEESILRCYHAVFFTLRAFLKKNKIEIKKTSDSIPVFKARFIDTKVLSSALHDDLLAVVKAGGFENQSDQLAADEALARDVYEKADRFYSTLTDLV